MNSLTPWYRRLERSEILSDRSAEAERTLDANARDLGIEFLQIQWYAPDEAQYEDLRPGDPLYFSDEAIKTSQRGNTIYLRCDWDLGTIRFEIAYRAASLANRGQDVKPVVYAREAGDRPRTVAREALIRRDQKPKRRGSDQDATSFNARRFPRTHDGPL